MKIKFVAISLIGAIFHLFFNELGEFWRKDGSNPLTASYQIDRSAFVIDRLHNVFDLGAVTASDLTIHLSLVEISCATVLVVRFNKLRKNAYPGSVVISNNLEKIKLYSLNMIFEKIWKGNLTISDYELEDKAKLLQAISVYNFSWNTPFEWYLITSKNIELLKDNFLPQNLAFSFRGEEFEFPVSRDVASAIRSFSESINCE